MKNILTYITAVLLILFTATITSCDIEEDEEVTDPISTDKI